jgi:hypothetical protein
VRLYLAEKLIVCIVRIAREFNIDARDAEVLDDLLRSFIQQLQAVQVI